MRVIAGKARRLLLVSPEGKNTRPTTDRIKETLFNMLQNDVYDSEFLDLFSGCGGIGIEALSRGAKHATFVEYERKALACIRTNLEKTKLAEQSTVLPMEVTYAVSRLEKQGRCFDIIYADPPYGKGYEEKLASQIAASTIVKPGTLLIFESSRETVPDYVDETVYEIVKIKEYITNQHLFLRVREGTGKGERI